MKLLGHEGIVYSLAAFESENKLFSGVVNRCCSDSFRKFRYDY